MGQGSMVKLGDWDWEGLWRSNLKMIEMIKWVLSRMKWRNDTEENRIDTAFNSGQSWRITDETWKLFFHRFAPDVFIVRSFSNCHFSYLLQWIAFSLSFDSRDTWNNQHFNLFWGVWRHWVYGASSRGRRAAWYWSRETYVQVRLDNERGLLVLSRRFVLCIDRALWAIEAEI